MSIRYTRTTDHQNLLLANYRSELDEAAEAVAAGGLSRGFAFLKRLTKRQLPVMESVVVEVCATREQQLEAS